MSVWDLTTIDSVERLYVTVHVARSVEMQMQPGVAEAVAGRLASTLRSEAHALTVEIHPDDVQVRRGTENDEFDAVEYVAHWQPSTGRCELRGGALDGTMYDTQLTRHQPLRIQRLMPAWTYSDPIHPIAVALAVDEYEVIGWSETGRHWVRAAR